jgi:methyltransferase (TIGR00027 family)
MQPAEPSRTAKIAAIARGQHRLLHRRPWIFDDPFALPLAGPGWQELYAALSAIFRDPVREEAIAFVGCARPRYAEDRLAAGTFNQYVILGAGLDSFAWRRPDALSILRVFEVDHPATQAWKQERAALLALPTSDGHVFAPIDFERQTLQDGLDSSEFDWFAPTLFSWLGVTAYLTTHAVEATLRAVAETAAGSEIVLSYATTEEFRDEIGDEFIATMKQVAADSGEPLVTFLSPTDAEELVGRCGLEVVDHPDRTALHDRYFADRDDGLTPYTAERVMTAVVTR